MVCESICCLKMGRKSDEDSEAKESLLENGKLLQDQPVDK